METAEIYKVASSTLDSVKDDCVKDLDGGAASRSGLPLGDSPSARSLSCPCVSIKQEGEGDVFQGHAHCLFDVGV